MESRSTAALPYPTFELEGFLYARAAAGRETPVTFTAKLLVRVMSDNSWVLAAYDPDDPLRNISKGGISADIADAIEDVWGQMSLRLAVPV